MRHLISLRVHKFALPFLFNVEQHEFEGKQECWINWRLISRNRTFCVREKMHKRLSQEPIVYSARVFVYSRNSDLWLFSYANWNTQNKSLQRRWQSLDASHIYTYFSPFFMHKSFLNNIGNFSLSEKGKFLNPLALEAPNEINYAGKSYFIFLARKLLRCWLPLIRVTSSKYFDLLLKHVRKRAELIANTPQRYRPKGLVNSLWQSQWLAWLRSLSSGA